MMACVREEALEILQKGKACASVSGQKVPACVVLNAVRYALCAQKPFADEPFGYFVATK
jgi:hypothetical protein